VLSVRPEDLLGVALQVTQVHLSFHVLHDGTIIYINSMQVYSWAILQ